MVAQVLDGKSDGLGDGVDRVSAPRGFHGIAALFRAPGPMIAGP
jgi:hypothetical protein